MMPDGWNSVPLGEVVNYKKGFAFKSEKFKDSGRRIIRISDTTASSIKNDSPVFVAEDDSLKDFELNSNDIILSTVGSRPPLYDSMVGKAIKVPSGVSGAYLNQNLVKLIPDEKVNHDFLFTKLKEPRFISYISTLVRGNANQVSITLDELFNYQLLLPPKNEQEKIAKILSTWDEAIAAVNTEIAKQQTQFEGLIISLYSGRRRFEKTKSKFISVSGIGSIPENWTLFPISDFARPVVRAVKKPEGKYTGLGIRSHGKGTFLKPDSEPEKIALEELFEVKKNDLLVSITFAWEGAIAIANTEDDGALTSHRFPAFQIDASKIYLNYLRYYIRKKSFTKQLGLISPGGAGRNRVLKKSDFLSLEVPVPSMGEQMKIGDALISSEKLGSLLALKRDLLVSQKLGLMQQLLTGKKRVKV